MKKAIAIISTSIILFNCKQIDKQIRIDKCFDNGGSWNYESQRCEYAFNSFVANRDKNNIYKITKYQELERVYQKALNTNNQDDIEEFIELFPNSFSEMQEYFGYNGEPAPLYDHEKGGSIIDFFSQLQPNKPEDYFNKYINICVNGKWEADNIRQAFGIHRRIMSDYDILCPILMQRNEEELISVFRFIFDGPHPDNKWNKELNQNIQKAIPNEYGQIKKYINFAYEILINEDQKH